jgi:hypothetical protein
VDERIADAAKAHRGWLLDGYRMAIESDSATKRTPIYIDSFPSHLNRNTHIEYTTCY